MVLYICRGFEYAKKDRLCFETNIKKKSDCLGQ